MREEWNLDVIYGSLVFERQFLEVLLPSPLREITFNYKAEMILLYITECNTCIHSEQHSLFDGRRKENPR